MSHYFMNDENLVSQVRELIYKYASFSFTFFSDNGVFSKKSIDYGSKLLVESYLKDDTTSKKVLDVGCGYGFIGIVVSIVNGSYVDMVDVNKRAVHLTKRNFKKYNNFKGSVFLSDAYSAVKDTYDVIITNPPIRVGKEKLLSILTGAFDHLKDNGVLFFFFRKDQGALSIKKILEKDRIVETINKDKGYFIYKVKKMTKY